VQVHSLAEITEEHRCVFLSPHFDDAVYSCGGTIALQGRSECRPLVITVFAREIAPCFKLSPFARKLHRVMGQGAALVQTRKDEDAQALALLQADYLWLNYPDAIYRGTPPLYRWKRAIAGRVHIRDLWIMQQLIGELEAVKRRFPRMVWYAPLALGGHVDHQLVFAAANYIRWLGAEVYFYEDFPYSMTPGVLQKRLRALANETGSVLKTTQHDVNDVLHLRQEASERYASQVALNFGSVETMYHAIEEYALALHPARQTALERFWHAPCERREQERLLAPL